MDELTKEDIEVLLEALESWEGRRLGGEILLGLTESFQSRGDEEARKEVQARMTRRAEANAEASKVDKERTVYIRIKLLKLRDKILIDRVTGK